MSYVRLILNHPEFWSASRCKKS